MDNKTLPVNADGGAESPESEVEFNPDIDYLLRSFVFQANGPDQMSMNITLFIKGIVVSGRLIGGRKFYEDFGRLYESGLEGATPGDFVDSLKETIDKNYPVNTDEETEQEESVRLAGTVYIHMSKARIYIPGRAGMPDQGLLWRGKLSEVDGWSIGSFDS